MFRPHNFGNKTHTQNSYCPLLSLEYIMQTCVEKLVRKSAQVKSIRAFSSTLTLQIGTIKTNVPLWTSDQFSLATIIPHNGYATLGKKWSGSKWNMSKGKCVHTIVMKLNGGYIYSHHSSSDSKTFSPNNFVPRFDSLKLL